MALTSSIKKAPKWAWYVAGGVGLGAVAIQVYKRRAVDTPDANSASSGADTIGTPSGGSAAPSPVITPPVIVSPGDNSPDFTGMFAVFGDALNNAVSTVSQLAQGDQGITQSTIGGAFDFARDVIANAGQAPAPAVSLPTPVVVQPPTANTPAVVTPAACPSAFPNHNAAKGAPSSASCYANCGHDECHGGKKSREHAHCYQNGSRQTVSWEVIGGRC